MDLGKIQASYEDVNRIELDQDRVQGWASVNMVMNL
jgi:hypothetical protein